jgi:adenylate cyclase
MRAIMRWFSLSRLAGLALVAALLAIRVADPAPVSALRYASFDLYQQIAPRSYTPAPVAIVDIDDPSLAELGQWPWPRTLVARMIERITAGGAAAVALDIVFAEPDRLSPDQLARSAGDYPPELRRALSRQRSNDAILAEAIAAGRVVVGQTSVRSAAANAATPGEVPSVPHAMLGPDPTPFLETFPDLVQNLPELEAAAAGRGVFTVRPDPDGIYRSVPLVMMVQDTIRLALAPELLRVATGGEAFAIRSNEAGVDGVVVGGQMIRTQADGTVFPYYSPNVPARYVSAADLIEGRVPPGRLAGHLVLVGTSAIGLEDYRATPLGVAMAGVEIHAQVLENILAGTMLVRPNTAIAVELVTLGALGLLVVVLVPIMPARWVIALALVLLAGYASLSWWAFSTRLQLLDPTWPIFGTLATLMLMSTSNYLREERERRRIRGAFGQYVSPDLVARLQEEPGELTLGGERREITLLFSDARGFTSIAESFREDPQGLTTLMNSFLNAMSRAILDERGTIDKFMGDAVMAFWNAPLDHDDHARAACRAALRMHKDVRALNADRATRAKETGEPALPIDIGIGINTGACIVGNMGSDMRFDYTALGDPVNLASRLEGQSKTYGVRIVLGAATRDAVAGDFATMLLDHLRVKGKEAPERVYALFGDAIMRADPRFARLTAANEAMRAAYEGRDWHAAGAHLDEVHAIARDMGVDLDAFRALYRERFEALARDPPPADWDGVATALTK